MGGHVRDAAKISDRDWGSFFAFDHGSIEVEIAGVKQRFRNFSELECSLNPEDGVTSRASVVASAPPVSPQLVRRETIQPISFAFSFAAAQASERKCAKLTLFLSSRIFLPEK